VDNCGSSPGICWYLLALTANKARKGVGMKFLQRFTHSFNLLTHSFSHPKPPSEQGFYALSTDSPTAYYYYLYIQETHPQANPTPTQDDFRGNVAGLFLSDLNHTQSTYGCEKTRSRAAA